MTGPGEKEEAGDSPWRPKPEAPGEGWPQQFSALVLWGKVGHSLPRERGRPAVHLPQLRDRKTRKGSRGGRGLAGEGGEWGDQRSKVSCSQKGEDPRTRGQGESRV